MAGAAVILVAGLGIAFHCLDLRAWKRDEEQRKEEEETKEKNRRNEREVERQERLAAEAKEHEIFLNTSVPCEGSGCSGENSLARFGFTRFGSKEPPQPPGQVRTHPRRQMWRLPENCGGKAVCAGCFTNRTGFRPVEGEHKRAFE